MQNSKPWLVFWSTVGTVTSLYLYDRNERKKTIHAFKEKAALLVASQAHPFYKENRKVKVFLSPAGDSVWVKTWFEDYVKPSTCTHLIPSPTKNLLYSM